MVQARGDNDQDIYMHSDDCDQLLLHLLDERLEYIWSRTNLNYKIDANVAPFLQKSPILIVDNP